MGLISLACQRLPDRCNTHPDSVENEISRLRLHQRVLTKVDLHNVTYQAPEAYRNKSNRETNRTYEDVEQKGYFLAVSRALCIQEKSKSLFNPAQGTSSMHPTLTKIGRHAASLFPIDATQMHRPFQAPAMHR